MAQAQSHSDYYAACRASNVLGDERSPPGGYGTVFYIGEAQCSQATTILRCSLLGSSSDLPIRA